MLAFVSALLPVIFIIALGHTLARRKWLSAEGWLGLEKLSYNVLFPAMIIRALANAPLDTTPWRMVIALALAQVILGAIGLLARLQPGVARPAVGTIIQSNVRWQTTIGLSLASLTFGDAGLALASIAAAVMIPLANVLSVFALTSHAERPLEGKPRPFMALAQNPLLWACAIGIGLATSSVTLPKIMNDTIGILGGAGLAAGLLSAGGGLDLSVLRRSGAFVLGWSIVRLIGLPVIVLLIGRSMGLEGMALYVAIICAGTPTASSSFVLAKQLGGDAPLAANLVAAQIVLAMLTLPFVWWASQHFAG